VGHRGSEAAWFVVNHDIASPTIMRHSLELMTAADDVGQASATLPQPATFAWV